MDAAAASRAVRLIRDQELFREACYINGRWRPAVGGASIPVDDPATGDIIGAVPKFGPRRDARGHRRRRRPRIPPGGSAPPKNAPRFSAAGTS